MLGFEQLFNSTKLSYVFNNQINISSRDTNSFTKLVKQCLPICPRLAQIQIQVKQRAYLFNKTHILIVQMLNRNSPKSSIANLWTENFQYQMSHCNKPLKQHSLQWTLLYILPKRDLGDAFHYLFVCDKFNEIRSKYCSFLWIL